MRKALAGVVLAGSVALTGCGGTHHHHTVHHVVIHHDTTHHHVVHSAPTKKHSVLKKIKSKLRKH